MIYLQGNQDEEYTRVCPYISLIIPPLHTNTEKIYCSNTFADIIISIIPLMMLNRNKVAALLVDAPKA